MAKIACGFLNDDGTLCSRLAIDTTTIMYQGLMSQVPTCGNHTLPADPTQPFTT